MAPRSRLNVRARRFKPLKKATLDIINSVLKKVEVPRASDNRSGPFYHYTDKKGAEAINKGGTLKPTQLNDGIDAAGGAGIYVTDKDPTMYSKTDILDNNYIMETSDNKGKADYVVPFTTHNYLWNVQKVRDGVYVITDLAGKPREMKVTGSGQIAQRKPEWL